MLAHTIVWLFHHRPCIQNPCFERLQLQYAWSPLEFFRVSKRKRKCGNNACSNQSVSVVCCGSRYFYPAGRTVGITCIIPQGAKTYAWDHFGRRPFFVACRPTSYKDWYTGSDNNDPSVWFCNPGFGTGIPERAVYQSWCNYTLWCGQRGKKKILPLMKKQAWPDDEAEMARLCVLR